MPAPAGQAWRKVMKKLISVVLVLAAVAGVGGWFYVSADTQPAGFRTAHVERGDLTTTINATGTIEPEQVIDVGAQVAGLVLSFGQDPRRSDKQIDYGSHVEVGTVLARIDESLYQAQVDRAKAQLAQANAGLAQAKAQVTLAEANIQRAEADLGQMQAKVYQTDRDWQRARQMKPSRAIADADYDLAEAASQTAKSGLGVGRASVAQAKATLKDAQANVAKAEATVVDAQANLDTALINLGYCTIKSPVRGVIVDRRVNVGQTVVSSLNAPSLFSSPRTSSGCRCGRRSTRPTSATSSPARW
jgi:HlyD family secretion protein